jgi:hypothetical protein
MDKERIKKLKATKKRIKENQEGGDFIFIKADTTIRVRPLPVAATEEFGLEIVHFFLGQDIKGVVSPQTFGEPCAIFEEWKRLKDSSDEDDRELAEKFKPKKKYVIPVLQFKDLKGKEIIPKSAGKLVLVTGGIYQTLVDYSLDPEQGDFTDPKKGYDLKLTRTGSGMTNTEYSVIPCRPTPLDKKYNKIYDVAEILRKSMPSYDETKSLLKRFMGKDSSSSKSSDQKKKKKKVKKDL